MTTTNDPTTDFDPFTNDMAGELARLRREHGATHWTYALGGDQPVLMVLTHDECRAVLRDHDTYSSTMAMGGPIASSNPDDVMEALPDFCRSPHVTGVVDVDPPRHDPLRRTVTRAFNLRWIKDQQPVARELAQHTAHQLPRGDVDLVQQYTRPYVQQAVGRVFGIPDDMLPQVIEWSEDMRTIVSPPQAVGGVEPKYQAAENLHDYAKWAVEFIQKQRGQRDIIGVYAHGDDRSEPLGLWNTMYSLLVHYVAGTVTTMHALASSIDFALRHPHVWSRLTNPDTFHSVEVFEETLRAAAPHRGLVRITTTDTILAGEHLPEGTLVLPMLQSAGRDENHYGHPDNFAPERDRLRDHMAFGHGKHRCAGSELGRSNGVTGLAVLAQTWPSARLVNPEQPTRVKPDFFFHGPEALNAVI